MHLFAVLLLGAGGAIAVLALVALLPLGLQLLALNLRWALARSPYRPSAVVPFNPRGSGATSSP
jgi:hypothetical protein